VLAHPLLGLRFLTFLFFGYLIGDGLWKILAALRTTTVSGWVWLLSSGILSLLLGILIWLQWPVPGNLAVGIIIGANLVSTGIALLALAGSMKDTLRNAIFALQSKKA
jgi:membrane protein HdeD